MQNPASPSKFRRTCPACNGRVGPGYKFCEACGTRIPELSTCSRCGTSSSHPVKYCDLCGAPVILPEVPKLDDSPEYSEEENTGQVEDQTTEREDEEIPGPGSEGLPEENDDENILPVKDKNPHHNKNEIQEPDTDELLEQYGKEYEEDETLESYHKPKSRSPIKHEPKKPGAVPAPSQPDIIRDRR